MREDELQETELRKHLTEWVRPAGEAAIPGVEKLHRRIRRKRIGFVVSVAMAVAVILTVALAVA